MTMPSTLRAFVAENLKSFQTSDEVDSCEALDTPKVLDNFLNAVRVMLAMRRAGTLVPEEPGPAYYSRAVAGEFPAVTVASRFGPTTVRFVPAASPENSERGDIALAGLRLYQSGKNWCDVEEILLPAEALDVPDAEAEIDAGIRDATTKE